MLLVPAQLRSFAFLSSLPGRLQGCVSRPAVIQLHLERLRRYKALSANDQFGTTCVVVRKIQGCRAVNHFALALTHCQSVEFFRSRHSFLRVRCSQSNCSPKAGASPGAGTSFTISVPMILVAR